jgi:uncharacterized repeat protein (TIGR03803 family)
LLFVLTYSGGVIKPAYLRKSKKANTKTSIKTLFLLPALMGGFGLLPAGRVTAQTFKNLYSFTTAGYDSAIEAETNSDGEGPVAGLVVSGNKFYGTASGGGTNGNGTVFALNIDGTGFTNLHTFTALSVPFTGTNHDGANPNAGLILSGSTLYGTAKGGGTNGSGAVFAINTDGSGFTNLHSFTALSAISTGTNSDGGEPEAGLILSGSMLFGTAYYGGANGNGTVFAININGTGFTNLHTFTAAVTSNFTNSDGANPEGGLVLSGNMVYGTAADGGAGGNGTVFGISTNGTGFTNIYSFSGGFSGNSDGASPFAGLVLSGNMLYGTTHGGGTSSEGAVFGVTTSGAVFTNLHSFTGYPGDGANPYAGLILSGNTLFGTAGNGGSNNDGTVFAIATNGIGYTTLHTFTNNPDGNSPHAVLILLGNTLYGTASGGGTNGSGMVFSLSLPTPRLSITHSGTNAIVTWPTNALEFTLQSATNLGPPVFWTTVSPPPYAVISTNSVVTNTISGTNQFYRLVL